MTNSAAAIATTTLAKDDPAATNSGCGARSDRSSRAMKSGGISVGWIKAPPERPADERVAGRVVDSVIGPEAGQVLGPVAGPVAGNEVALVVASVVAGIDVAAVNVVAGSETGADVVVVAGPVIELAGWVYWVVAGGAG